MAWRRKCRHRDPTVRRRTDRRPRSLAGLNPPGWELSFRDALIRGNSQQRDCEDPCKMTYTISASSTRHPVALLGYSAPWPAATVEAKVVKHCWKMTLRCCRFRAVHLRLVAVADGCGARRWPAKEVRKCRSLRAQLSNHSGIAWRPAMPWVALVRRGESVE